MTNVNKKISYKTVFDMNNHDFENEIFPLKYPHKEFAAAFIPEDRSPFKNAVIGITYPNPDYVIERNNSSVTVLEYVLEGEGELTVNGSVKKVKAGNVYVLREGENHRYSSNPQNPWKKIWINYVSDYAGALLDSYGIHSGVYTAETAHSYFEQLFEFSKISSPNRSVFFAIADCVHRIINSIAVEKFTEKSDASKIKEALNASVYEKLNLNVLAARLHLSKSNMIRIFKKSFGTTPYEYLLSLKISTAKLLLKNSKMTVKDISDRLKFSDEHYFSTLFLARVGMRPRDYRSNHK